MFKSFFVLFFLTISNLYGQYGFVPAFPRWADSLTATELVNSQDGTNRLFVTYLQGPIIAVENPDQRVFMDLSNKISQDFELGLLGLTFHPNFETNRYFYVHYIMDSVGSLSGRWIRVSKFTASSSQPDYGLIDTEEILFTIPLPNITHNGGKVAFGPDGYLYIALGDGGSGGDLAQDRTELLGKILRIDVDLPSGGNNYSIPPTNPYYGNTKGFREEIYAYGFRNPWKFSFDFETNRMWLGDVMQFRYEEINLIESGKNYGWNLMEGFHCYPDTTVCDTLGRDFTLPIWEYEHPIGFTVIGGYVYRGSSLPGLYGKYIYGDFYVSKIWALTYDGINPVVNELLMDLDFWITSFGVDESNELFLLAYSGDIYKLSEIITLNLKIAIEGLYDVTNDRLNLSDTLKAYLHLTTFPYTIIDSSTTVIDSLTFSGLCMFNEAPTGEYYIRINHRNSIETWSKFGGEILTTGKVSSYDFTSASSQAFGNNLILKGTKYCIYSGDVNQDGFIDILDISSIYNDAVNSVSGYVNTDVNGDYLVDILDISIAYNNSTNSVSFIRP